MLEKEVCVRGGEGGRVKISSSLVLFHYLILSSSSTGYFLVSHAPPVVVSVHRSPPLPLPGMKTALWCCGT